MNNSRYSRRNVLKTLGLAAGFLPLLEAERAVAATASGFPTRFIAITWCNGTVFNDFYPPAGAFSAPLPAILTPLEPYKSKVLSFRSSKGAQSPIDLQCMLDANQNFGGHSAYPAVLSGTWKSPQASTGASIDQMIATQLMTQNVASPLLNLGARNFKSSTSFKATGQSNTPQTDPYKLFSSMFAGAPAKPGVAPVAPPSAPSGPSPASALKARRTSVLDFVSAELKQYAGRLGKDDNDKIQSHLDSVSALEQKLAAMGQTTGGGTTTGGGNVASGAGCAQPAQPAGKPVLTSLTEYPDLVGAQMAIAGAAVKCDYARCVTIDLIDDGGGNSLAFPWLNIPSPDYHAIAHKGKNDYTDKTKIDNWFYTKVAELVKDLDSTPEGSGTVLDNTCILVCNDMSEGSFHDVHQIPYLIIGGCGGFFKTGQCVSFPKSVPNNQLLTSICHAMGMPSATVGTYAGDLDSLLKA
jgi:hypothetical protein